MTKTKHTLVYVILNLSTFLHSHDNFLDKPIFWLPQNGKDQLLHKTLYCSVPNKRVGGKFCLFLYLLLFEKLMLIVFVFKIDKHSATFIQHTSEFILIGSYINKI